MLFQMIAFVLIVVGVVMLLGLTPDRITNDMMGALSKKPSLKTRISNARGNKKPNRLIDKLIKLSNAMKTTNKETQFTFVCALSLALFVVGGAIGVLIDNIFIIPIFCVVFALLPFFWARSLISSYEKHIEDEIETALSMVTNSYIRSDDFVLAVKESLPYIKPPVKQIFNEFIGEVTILTADTKKALKNLRGKIDNDIFKEWVDTIILCQEDRTLNDTLIPILSKLTDVRIVNSELKTMLDEPKKEYFMMVVMVFSVIPLLYVLNKDWYGVLMHTNLGKITLAVAGVVILITSLLLMKFTKPIKYRR